MKGIYIIVTIVFVLGLFLMSGESHAVTILPNETYKSTKPIPLFSPPYLCPMKSVNPTYIWKNDSGKTPDNVTVTLRVDAYGEPYNNSMIAAVQVSPTDPMVIDVLPPYIVFLNSSVIITSNNNVTITKFNTNPDANGTLDLLWYLPVMKLGEIFEVQYKVKSNLVGWQSVGVGMINSTKYGSNRCEVHYGDYLYNITKQPMDTWANCTNDASIFVQTLIPEFTLPIITFTVFVAVAVWYRRKL